MDPLMQSNSSRASRCCSAAKSWLRLGVRINDEDLRRCGRHPPVAHGRINFQLRGVVAIAAVVGNTDQLPANEAKTKDAGCQSDLSL